MQTATATKTIQRTNTLDTDQVLVAQLIKERLQGPFLSLAEIKKKIKQDFKPLKARS
jgi:predicted nucleic acid-binding OB-fold protein